MVVGLAIFINGFSSILTGLNFIVTIHTMRAPGNDVVPPAAFRLVTLRGQPRDGAGHAGDRDHGAAALRSRGSPTSVFSTRRSAATRSCSSIFFGSTRIRPFTSWCCRGWASCRELISNFSRKEDLRLRIHRVLVDSDRGLRLPGLGTSSVRQRPVDICGNGVLVPLDGRCRAVGDQDVQLDRDALQRLDLIRYANAVRARVSWACS